MKLDKYDELIRRKVRAAGASGFEPGELNAGLFEWQRLIVQWAVRRGRAALFEDCGLGKTIQQLEWARQVHEHTNANVLILCPLAVAEQTVEEGAKFGIQVHHARGGMDVKPGINVTNYERIDLFEVDGFAGVVLDESSILKAFTGVTRRKLTSLFAGTSYRLCCTATPAPNDFTELGQHADFLGVCSPSEMLATYFINDTFDTGTWRLKGHAQESFWRWVSSWAVCVSAPGDLGFSNEGFILPPVKTEIIKVAVDHAGDAGSGELFRNPHVSATQLHAENRRTLEERVNAAAEVVNSSKGPFIVWCETNDESELLAKRIDGAVEVKGSDSPESKERNLHSFSHGDSRVIVTKPRIAGFGLNWQHCNQEIFVGLNHSYERFYQACKRTHRFGQKRKIHRYIVQTDLEDSVLRTIQRKADQHETMKDFMRFSADAILENKTIITMNTEIHSETTERWTLYNGDCVRVAKKIEDESVGLSVFSPPFADLFTYSSDVQDMGNCRSLDDFMEQFDFLIDELLRITMPGRECVVHLADLLATKWKDGEIEYKDFSGHMSQAFRSKGWLLHSRIAIWKSPVTEMQRTKAHGLLYKTLCSDSSKSRVGSADYLLVFRKRGENPKPIKHSPEDFPLDKWQELASPVWWTVDQGRVLNGEIARESQDERHICPLQLDVIERALVLWSAPEDLVYSPFAGIGSEGFCAVKAKRRFVGSELKKSYFETACDNLRRAESEMVDLFTAAELAL